MILAGAPIDPSFLGFDVYTVGTILLAVATATSLLALYGAVKMKDPMSKRVKALVDRREQLKAGITASTSKKRAKLVRNTNTTDQVRNWLSSMKSTTCSCRIGLSAMALNTSSHRDPFDARLAVRIFPGARRAMNSRSRRSSPSSSVIRACVI